MLQASGWREAFIVTCFGPTLGMVVGLWVLRRVPNVILPAPPKSADGGLIRAAVSNKPALLIVLPEEANPAWQRHIEFPDWESMGFHNAGLSGNRILFTTSDGFRLGNAADVNESAKQYHYIAWGNHAGTMATGQYTGNVEDDREIVGPGFQPHYVLIKANSNVWAAHRPASLGAGDISMRINPSAHFVQTITV